MRKTLRAGVGAALIAAALVGTPFGAPAAAAENPPLNGSSSTSAAASCWAIKQSFPTSADGVYWLVTPALGAPQRFYCDMTTDGGGWILVGRGRQGWGFGQNGQGAESTVFTTPSGTAAFTPAALAGKTIDGLMNGGRTDSLPDGIRVRRARDSAGTTWQEMRFKVASQDTWNWAFGGGIITSSVTINGTVYNGSNLGDTMANYNGQTTNQLAGINDDRRMFAFPWTSHANQAGFSYGNTITGANNATSYLWQNANERNAIPFAQVFVRPKITNAGFTAIPDSGLPAEQAPALLNSKPDALPWGVTSSMPVAEAIEPRTSIVMSMFQLGSRMFVGGRHANVQQGSTGTPISQPWVAAFDVNTGEWLSDFRPVLNGRVWDMAALPSGKLLIAGDFTSVNGAANTTGMAAVDPVTGAVDSTFKGTFTRNGASNPNNYPPMVRSVDVGPDGSVYAAGLFNFYTGGTWGAIRVSNAVKINPVDGRPIQAWAPIVPANTADLDVNAAGTRVYLVGFFDRVNSDTSAAYSAVLSTSTGALVPGIKPWVPASAGARYQQAVLETNGHIYQGGSEHNLQMYTVGDRTLEKAVNYKNGGDVQALTEVDGIIYVACHCANWSYQDANTWPTPLGYSRVNPVNWIGAYDANTFKQIPEFQPTVDVVTAGEGAWDLVKDTNGCLWFGGDFSRRGFTGTPSDWVGNFGRMCAIERQVPTTPGNLSTTLAGNDVQLSWSGSTDNSGSVSYQVLRDDRVIGTVTGATTFTDPARVTSSRYFVRAVDEAGNKSPTSNGVTVNPPASALPTLVTAGSTWSYRADGVDQGKAWRNAGFDTSTWSTGAAEFGWGDGDEATVLTPTTPITSYYVKTFPVTNLADVRSAKLRLKRDDGAIVYLNGVEVARSNMPSGPVTAATPAASFISGTGETTWQELTLPASIFASGTNTIAVELHQGGGTNGDATFDLELVPAGTGPESTPPSAPTLTATGANGGMVNLVWTGSTDASGVAGYSIKRDGTLVAVVPGGPTTWTDSGLGASETHTYEVTAYDTYGNVSTPATASATTGIDPKLVTAGSMWRYRFAAGDPGANWNGVGFDDSTWSNGTGEIGYGDGDETTVIPIGPTPRPVTAYFRTTINIGNPAAIAGIAFSVIRDDGAVVYVNGVEIGRDNMPAGTITPTTPASTALSTRVQETTPWTFTVSPSPLVAGPNVIAVEVHNPDAYSGDLSFALTATAT